MLSNFIFLVALLMATSPAIAVGSETDTEIQFLLTRVSDSGYVFVRNGKDHSAEDAADHMRRKYKHFEDEIKTPEQFVEFAATKSMMTGRRYRIRFSDGTEMDTADWLLGELAAFRSEESSPRLAEETP